MNFVSNRAVEGGVVYSVASGKAYQLGTGLDSEYIDCMFRDDTANASGGAVESVAGRDDCFSKQLSGKYCGGNKRGLEAGGHEHRDTLQLHRQRCKYDRASCG